MELWGFDSRWLYTLLVGLVAAERLVELAISSANVRRALARGGFEAGRGHYPWMVLLHAAFLAGCPLEAWLLRRPFLPLLAAAMVALLAGAMGLRYWAIATLGRRWTTRVVGIPGEPPVTGGPYRFLRHPNYLAVVVEGVALPLVHSAWLTALAFTAANLALLRVRIPVEEEALERASAHRGAPGGRPPLEPRRR